MSGEQVAFEGISWLIVLILAVLVLAIQPAEKRREPERAKEPEDDFRWWM